MVKDCDVIFNECRFVNMEMNVIWLNSDMAHKVILNKAEGYTLL